MTVTPHFRQLIEGMTSEAGWEAIAAHIAASISEGFCPMCGKPMSSDQVDCASGGPRCRHGNCRECRHSQHYDPDDPPFRPAAAEIPRIRELFARVADAIDGGGHVHFSRHHGHHIEDGS